MARTKIDIRLTGVVGLIAVIIILGFISSNSNLTGTSWLLPLGVGLAVVFVIAVIARMFIKKR